MSPSPGSLHVKGILWTKLCICWLHSPSSGHTCHMQIAVRFVTLVWSSFAMNLGIESWDMHMQVENGLVETVAVLISKMPRLRPSLPPGSAGQAHSFKPEFSRVRWSSAPFFYVCWLCFLFRYTPLCVASLSNGREIYSSKYWCWYRHGRNGAALLQSWMGARFGESAIIAKHSKV